MDRSRTLDELAIICFNEIPTRSTRDARVPNSDTNYTNCLKQTAWLGGCQPAAHKQTLLRIYQTPEVLECLLYVLRFVRLTNLCGKIPTQLFKKLLSLSIINPFTLKQSSTAPLLLLLDGP